MALLTIGANVDMVVAGILTLIIFYLVGMAYFQHDIKFAIISAPLAMLTVGLMISVSIVKSSGR